MLMVVAAVAALLQTPAPPPPGPVTDGIIRSARAALDERLLDYPSARFRDVHGNAMVVCGFVNAKNRMGAYTGWSRFAYVDLGSDPYLLVDDAEGSDDIMLDALCGDDGKRLTGADLSTRFAAQ